MKNQSQQPLAPCPFCGETPTMLRTTECHEWELVHKCGSLTVKVSHWLRERVITSWNRRQPAKGGKL